MLFLKDDMEREPENTIEEIGFDYRSELRLKQIPLIIEEELNKLINEIQKLTKNIDSLKELNREFYQLQKEGKIEKKEKSKILNFLVNKNSQ